MGNIHKKCGKSPMFVCACVSVCVCVCVSVCERSTLCNALHNLCHEYIEIQLCLAFHRWLAGVVFQGATSDYEGAVSSVMFHPVGISDVLFYSRVQSEQITTPSLT